MTDSLFQSAFAISPPSYLTATPLSWHMQPLEKIYARVKLCTRNTCAGLWHALWHICSCSWHTYDGEQAHEVWDANTQVNMFKLALQLVPLDCKTATQTDNSRAWAHCPYKTNIHKKVQQPHSRQTEMSSLSWIMSWQTHALLVQFSKSARMD